MTPAERHQRLAAIITLQDELAEAKAEVEELRDYIDRIWHTPPAY